MARAKAPPSVTCQFRFSLKKNSRLYRTARPQSGQNMLHRAAVAPVSADIAQERKKCQFAFPHDEKSAVVSVGVGVWPEYRVIWPSGSPRRESRNA